MRLSLSTSLHLDHGALPMDAKRGSTLQTMQSFVPIGLLSLKASCEAVNPETQIRVVEVNTLLNRGEIANGPSFHDRVARAVLQSGADVAGLMTDADSLHHTVIIAQAIKRVSPATLVCLGGPASSPIADTMLKRFAWIDMIVRGEGEDTFAELVTRLSGGDSVDSVAGLSWRTPRGEVRRNSDRPPIDDLDRLPVPDFAAFDAIESAALYLDVGRGCPFSCSFCSTAPFWNRRFRMKSIPRIIDEMRLLRERWGREHINYSHDIFTADRKWTLRFCAALEAAALGVTWACSTRTDCIDEETLAAMARAGCVEIYYGIETGDTVMQHAIAKDLDLERSLGIVRATRAVGIRPVTGFIVGYPDETLASYGETVTRFFDFLDEGGHRAHLFTLCPFPGAPMFDTSQAQIATPAEDREVPLDASSHAEAEAVVKAHRDLFASRYRYATPNVPWPLIACTEEVSAHMVVLKRVWPHVIPLFESATELFERWSAFISECNRKRPWRRRYHGDTTDLIDFLQSELHARGETCGAAADLLRYEAAMVAALTIDEPAAVSPRGQIGDASVVCATRPYLIECFHHDISALLTGARPARPAAGEMKWVVFSRAHHGGVKAVAISDIGRRLLELAEQPRSATSLIDAIAPPLSSGETARARGFAALQTLEALNLIQEICP